MQHKKEDQIEDLTTELHDTSLRFRSFSKTGNRILTVLMIVYVLYFIYAAGFQGLPGIEHRSIYLTGALVFTLLLYPISTKLKNNRVVLGFDILLAIMSVIAGIYVYSTFQTYNSRVGLPPTFEDVLIGILAFLIMFEVARRVAGWGFVIIVSLFVGYAIFGTLLPEPFTHSGFDIPRFIATFFLTTNGPFGQITGIAADFILLFIIFAAFIRISGTAEFFHDLALILFGKWRGGAGKIAVVASSLMGMLTGSSIANVASVGSITIPMMKRTGFNRTFAGGVEACSSLGSQIMPPIMGSTVFIMMELLGMSYWDIAKASFIVGILFYISLFFMIDLEATKNNLRGVDIKEIPKFKTTLKNGWYNLIPILVLLYMIAVAGVSPARAGFWGIVSSLLVMFIFDRTTNLRNKILKVKNAMVSGATDSLVIGGIVALASLMAGIISVSGLGLHLSNIMINLANGSLFVLLIITAIVAIILGTGVPILVAYSVLAVIVAPSLISMGVNPLAAHLFIFYFGVISGISPPSAPDAFVAAGIAKAPPFKVAWSAMRIANVLYIVPFLFVYNDVLLLNGSVIDILIAFCTAMIGTYCVASALQGIILPNLIISWWKRIVMAGSGLMLIIPDIKFSILGLIIVVTIHIIQFLRNKKSLYDNKNNRLEKIIN
nr:TRAP transporter permease [Fredinandcohnia onubensis]